MSDEDKQAIESMDMEKMISHVTQNVFKMMNNNELNEVNDNLPEIIPGIFGNIMGNFNKTNETPPKILDLELNEKRPLLPKTRDICFDLNVDLCDFYTGKKKKLNIKRKCVTIVDGKQKIIEEKKKIIIPIEKGMKDNQKICFEGEADQIPGYKPGDIVITLIENEHPFFQREGDNLIIIKNINIYQLYNYSFDITHLDSRIIRVTKDENDALHLNDSLRKISGIGMPVYRSESYGDLFVRFNLVIPKSLSNDKLVSLKEIFNDSDEKLNSDYSCEFSLENVSETDLEDFDSSESESEISETDSEISVSSVSSSELSSDSSSGQPVKFKKR
jgi:DnaJ-class molecular chaperone